MSPTEPSRGPGADPRTRRDPDAGRRLDPRADRIDRTLEEVTGAFDFLKLVSPDNGAAARRAYEAGDRSPRLTYRDLGCDPGALRRRLDGLRIDGIDPLLREIFEAKRTELDRQLRMLERRGDPEFLELSVAVYGGAEARLVAEARALLDSLPDHAPPGSGAPPVDAERFVERARAEIDRYRGQWPGFEAEVATEREITSGLLVSGGRLVVSEESSFPEERVQPLLDHEVGTHLLTFFNGTAQPLRQLYCGLAGASALQEGLAVIAEYLPGGLTCSRLRTLAARVVAVDALLGGAELADGVDRLTREDGFDEGDAFGIVLRVFRGGGLTKDAGYLRGVGWLLRRCAEGMPLERLLCGKVAIGDDTLLERLDAAGYRVRSPLRPHWLDRDGARSRLETIERGLEIHRMAEDL